MFCPQAVCKTIVPDTFGVLLSQRRRWINSTVHNLFELIVVPDLCGVFCFSMRFVSESKISSLSFLALFTDISALLFLQSSWSWPVPSFFLLLLLSLCKLSIAFLSSLFLLTSPVNFSKIPHRHRHYSWNRQTYRLPHPSRPHPRYSRRPHRRYFSPFRLPRMDAHLSLFPTNLELHPPRLRFPSHGRLLVGSNSSSSWRSQGQRCTWSERRNVRFFAHHDETLGRLGTREEIPQRNSIKGFRNLWRRSSRKQIFAKRECSFRVSSNCARLLI